MTFLDVELIRSRRRELHLTERDLGKAIGRSSSVVRGMERGRAHGDQPLSLLFALAQTLGVGVSALLRERADENSDAAPSDVVLVEAALANIDCATTASVIAAGLAWPLPRVRQALVTLREQRARTGLRVQHHAGKWRLVPAVDLLPKDAARTVERADIGQRRLSISQARILRDVARGRVGTRWLTNASIDQENQLHRLRRLGYVEECSSGWALTEDVRLGLQVN